MGKNTLYRGRHYTCRHLKIKRDKNIKKIEKSVDKEYGLWYYKNVPRNE